MHRVSVKEIERGIEIERGTDREKMIETLDLCGFGEQKSIILFIVVSK